MVLVYTAALPKSLISVCEHVFIYRRGKQSVRHFQATLTEQGIMLGNKSFPTAELFAEHFRSGIIIGDESGILPFLPLCPVMSLYGHALYTCQVL